MRGNLQAECWKCGDDLSWATLPLRRLEACKACGSELHVCRMCEFYDTNAAKSCRETVAEEVKEKDCANFCGYLVVNANAWQGGGVASSNPGLAALFGDDATLEEGSEDGDATRNALDDLFGGER